MENEFDFTKKLTIEDQEKKTSNIFDKFALVGAFALLGTNSFLGASDFLGVFGLGLLSAVFRPKINPKNCINLAGFLVLGGFALTFGFGPTINELMKTTPDNLKGFLKLTEHALSFPAVVGITSILDAGINKFRK